MTEIQRQIVEQDWQRFVVVTAHDGGVVLGSLTGSCGRTVVLADGSRRDLTPSEVEACRTAEADIPPIRWERCELDERGGDRVPAPAHCRTGLGWA